MREPTATERVVANANQRALELWVAGQARLVHVPWRTHTAATVALSEPGERPTIMVLTRLRPRAWFALGLLHVFAWWKIREALDQNINGFEVTIWVT